VRKSIKVLKKQKVAVMANLVDLPSNGLHVIQGELTILLNSMRRPFKWSSQIHQVGTDICLSMHIVYFSVVLKYTIFITQ